jgi:hypothetical protein
MAEPVHSAHLTIRRATIADAPVVHEITDLAYARYVPLLGREPQPMTADHQAMIAEHEVWLLVDDGAPLGVLELIFEPGCTLIYSVAVRPSTDDAERMLLDWAERAARGATGSAYAMPNGRQLRLYSDSVTETGRRAYLGSTTCTWLSGWRTPLAD